MFLNDVHVSNAHEGVEYLRAIVQQLFWVLGLRSELRRICLSCVFCTKRCNEHICKLDKNPRPFYSTPMISAPMMSDLPSERLEFGSALFAYTGIDFLGFSK